MNLRLPITIILLVVIGIAVYLLKDVIIVADFLTQIVVGIVLTIPFIAIWGLKPLIERTQGNSKLQEQKDHTIDLMNIYKRLCQTRILQDRSGYQIVLPKKYKEFASIESEIAYLEFKQSDHWQTDYVSLEYHNHYRDYDYLEDALKHLEHKSYKETYRHWTKTKKMLDEFNKRPKFHSKLHETIDSKMKESFPAFQKGYGENFESAYDPYVISDVVTNLWFVERVRFDFLEIRDKYGKPSIITQYGTRPQLSSLDKNKLDLDKYKKLLESIVTDSSLKQMLLDEDNTFSKIFTELEIFQKKLLTMIKNHKHKIINGKCDSCP